MIDIAIIEKSISLLFTHFDEPVRNTMERRVSTPQDNSGRRISAPKDVEWKDE